MAAIPNKIVIGDEESPILVFENDGIISISEESAVALIGDELFVDQFSPTVKYNAQDGYELRKLPYGTKISFYTDNRISGIFYCEKVERTGKELYQINAISAIGLMDKQRSMGGIYTGQRFDVVLREVVGEEYEYTINEDVAALQVYGWLPYSTKRQNLHQLIMAYGVNIVRADNGGMLFTFLIDSTPQEISASRIYNGGKVTYNDPASRVEVVEHLYHFLESGEEETLFDNTSNDAVFNALITFDKPVYPDSLRVLDGGLIILDSGVNYAVITGMGVLVGKPYIHTTKVVAIDNEDAVIEKVVRVEEASLVTLVNSENVLARLAEYYFNATTIENSIIVDTEKCGRRYSLLNAFYEQTSGFMARMSTSVSSIKKAACELIADYVPKGQGSAYTNIVILPEGSGTWTVPEKVFEKDVPSIRVVLIGGGEAGTDGAAGEDGKAPEIKAATTTIPASGEGGAGGAGGAGGLGGAGGKVFSTTIDCTGISSFSYGRNGINTYFRGGGNVLNSDLGVSSETGYLEIFSGTVYALPGHDGATGGAGGRGGLYPPPDYGEGYIAEHGENVTYNGYIAYGGAGAPREIIDDYYVGRNDVYCGGGGGGGAAARAWGEDGVVGQYSHGGKGADGPAANPATALYGCGGNGGHGGGGGGGGGVGANYNYAYSHWVGCFDSEGGSGGTGGAGSEGYQGCVIIYY